MFFALTHSSARPCDEGLISILVRADAQRARTPPRRGRRSVGAVAAEPRFALAVCLFGRSNATLVPDGAIVGSLRDLSFARRRSAPGQDSLAQKKIIDTVFERRGRSPVLQNTTARRRAGKACSTRIWIDRAADISSLVYNIDKRVRANQPLTVVRADIEIPERQTVSRSFTDKHKGEPHHRDFTTLYCMTR